MSVEVIRMVGVVIVALIGSGFGLAWRKMSAEAASITAQARATDITTDGDLRRQLREMDAELVVQRCKRMDLHDAIENLTAHYDATIASMRAEQADAIAEVRHRVEKLEAWIVTTTGVDPATINGWKDKP